MVKIIRFNDFEDIGKRLWSEVLSRSASNYIFQTYDYLRVWWEHFGRGHKDKEALILTVEKHGSLIAFAPLMIDRTRFFNAPLIKFMGGDICDYMDFIAYPDAYNESALLFLDYIRRFHFILADLKYIPEDSGMIADLSGFSKQTKMTVKVSAVEICPYIDLSGGLPGVCGALKSKLRSEISRNDRAMQENGSLEFLPYTGETRLKDTLKDYFNLHIKKWKGYSKKYSQFQYKNWREFVTDLCLLLRPKGELDLSCLKIGKSVAACHFGFVYNKRFYYYMPTFNPDFAQYSPSKTLIMRMLERSCGLGLNEFDFLRGNEPYKMLWTKSSRRVYNLAYFNRNPLLFYPGLAYVGIHNRVNNRLKPFLKKIAPLMSAWYGTRGENRA